MFLQNKVDYRIEQRMPRSDERSRRLSIDANAVFQERDALVRLQHWCPPTGHAVALTNFKRNVADFKSTFLFGDEPPAKMPKRFGEEGANVMRLKAARLGTLHHFTNFLHA